ncbi:MAG TPA: RagB/SusD family nutrient uptake outer membrane protein [Steroidobacteraceae bacterium]|nr:RagB/SusD family nutrient uptake outer membrane protein [Steroidobacteraceae bacterium]
MNRLERLGLPAKALITATTACIVVACGSGSLNKTPDGSLTQAQISTPANLDGLVTAAYSWLGNDHYTDPNFFWPTGNIRGGDAHKGGNGPGDVYYYHLLTLFNLVTAAPQDIDAANRYWIRWFDGISRVNTALSAINPVSAADYPDKTSRIGELHFLRGVFYFWLKTHFDRVPYYDETMLPTAVISNAAMTSQKLWDAIAADFTTAMANLPKAQSQVGRANYYAAEAYLAKTLLYQAYLQDPTSHAVISIDQAKLAQVVSLVTDVESSGKYALLPDYSQNFLPQYDNNQESIFAIQRSVNDGSAQGNGGRGTFSSALNYPVGDSGFGCCGFHIPSADFVNSFKTLNGLPFDGYNGVGPAADYSFANNNYATQPIDPRLDHSVNIHGKPFKYCTIAGPTCIHDGDNWARDPGFYGSNIGMKDLVSRDSSALVLNGPFFISSMNTVLMRYADLELFKAEALVELNQGDLGLSIINALRARAAASTANLNTNPNAAAVFLYNVKPYPAFPDQATARKALRNERRLEMGLEGFRFFDLVRWGVAKQTLDQYFADESLRRPYLTAASFTAGRDEYLPIPQVQVNLSGGLYVQNPGY